MLDLTSRNRRLMTAEHRQPRERLQTGPILVFTLAGALLEGVYLALWVFGYPISQAPDWSVAFLTQHQDLWDAFRPLLEAAQLRWPVEMGQTEALTNVLVLLFTGAYLAYGVAIWSGQRIRSHLLLAVAMIWALIHQATLILMPRALHHGPLLIRDVRANAGHLRAESLHPLSGSHPL